MRKGEITEAMIRQSKEIWELLKPGEFVPEPGDWISALHIHWLMYEPHYIDERGNLRDKWYSMIQFGSKEWHPIFTFSHCLDLLKGWGWFLSEHCDNALYDSLPHLKKISIRITNKAAGKFNGGGDNSHEAAQAVLLKVLKGES